MLRSRLLPWLFSSGLFLAAACSDSVSPKSQAIAGPTTPSQPYLFTLTGSVQLTGEKLYPVILSTSDGQQIRLTGDAANLLVSVENAGVEIHGQWESIGETFLVNDFLVRTVDGAQVVDGTLVAEYSTPTDLGGDPVGFAIRPTSGGFDIMIDASPDLLTHLNQRLWVAGVDAPGTAPTAYGVIREM